MCKSNKIIIYLALFNVLNILPISPPALSVIQSASKIGCIAALNTPSKRYPTTLRVKEINNID